MSLLMDALKKAELAKQAHEPAGELAAPEAEPPRPGSPEPLPEAVSTTAEPKTPPVGLPELPSRLEVLDQEFLAHASQPPPFSQSSHQTAGPATPADSPSPRHEAKQLRAESDGATPAMPRTAVPARKLAAAEKKPDDRAGAKSVFAAKQPAPKDNKTFVIVVGVSTLMAIVGIGVYFGLQLQSLSRPTPPVALAPMPSVPPTLQMPSSAPTPPPVPSLTATPLASEQGIAATVTAAQPNPPAELRSTKAEQPSHSETIFRGAEAGRTNAQRRTAAPESDSPIRITTGRLKLNPALTQAYDALNAGDFATARNEYGKVLQSDPRNPDALHGLAAIALKQSQFGIAEDYYLRAIESDPRDAVAQAGLMGLRGHGDPLASESRLKSLIAAQPDQPFLHFALGNVHAAGGRWQEAQQGFFKAWSGDPDNPDYLFNLAVALDHLRQSRLAIQYYTQAVAAADKRPANFDRMHVATRLHELQQ